MSEATDKQDIIVATDGTEAAQNAVRYAGVLLHPDMHRLIGVRVVKEPTEIFWKAQGNNNGEQTMQQIEEEAAMQLEDDFEALENNFDVERKVLRGEPQDKICEVAQDVDALGIIMGHRDFAGREEVLLGSVSNYVTHNAPCPVTVVPRLSNPSDRRNIIVASDGTEAASHALEYVESLLHPDKHRLVALRVIEPPSEAPWQAQVQSGNINEVLDDMEKEARSQLGSEFSDLESSGFEVDRKVLRGSPQDAICDLADEIDALGIIMGRREFDDQEDVLMGSVSNYVAHNASSPVTVVPRGRFH